MLNGKLRQHQMLSRLTERADINSRSGYGIKSRGFSKHGVDFFEPLSRFAIMDCLASKPTPETLKFSFCSVWCFHVWVKKRADTIREKSLAYVVLDRKLNHEEV